MLHYLLILKTEPLPAFLLSLFLTYACMCVLVRVSTHVLVIYTLVLRLVPLHPDHFPFLF